MFSRPKKLSSILPMLLLLAREVAAEQPEVASDNLPLFKGAILLGACVFLAGAVCAVRRTFVPNAIVNIPILPIPMIEPVVLDLPPFPPVRVEYNFQPPRFPVLDFADRGPTIPAGFFENPNRRDELLRLSAEPRPANYLAIDIHEDEQLQLRSPR